MDIGLPDLHISRCSRLSSSEQKEIRTSLILENPFKTEFFWHIFTLDLDTGPRS